jgi:DNA-binding transcriptional LysR family regulator
MAPDRWKRFAPYPAQSDAPSLSELINCGPLWTPSTTSRFYTDISDVLRHHGAHLHNINTCDDMRMMADLIGMSGGLGYLPAVLIGDILAQQKLVLVPGLPSTGESEYYFVWRQLHLLPIVRTLMKLGQAESEVGEAP